MKSKFILVGGFLIAILVGIYSFWPPAETAGHIDPSNEALIAMGKKIYTAQCASCHGKQLEGQRPNWREKFPDGRWPAPPHDATGHTWHHSDHVLFEVTKYGYLRQTGRAPGSTMPGFGTVLSNREIWAVLSFIKKSWPAEIQKRHDMINRRWQMQQ